MILINVVEVVEEELLVLVVKVGSSTKTTHCPNLEMAIGTDSATLQGENKIGNNLPSASLL
jgi:hypothetical protein